MQLESKLYNVLGVECSGETTIEKLDEIKPDLVLMDYTIKGNLNGVQTADIISEKYHIPVVCLTAHTDDHTMEQIKNSSAISIIIKPILIDELDQKIQSILNKK